MKTLKTIDKWCKGCGICVEFCPKNVLGLIDDKVTVQNKEECIFCGQCELRCPDYAIFAEENNYEQAGFNARQ
ncbi:MAG: 4Fe-4S binding protein [Clostridiaceae bacterium]|nr:4Fe-4S binding protein [Clostridiaceae bacterium]